jgi:hypothetical protein
MTYNLYIFKTILQIILNAIIRKGSHTSQTFRVAYILLNCDEGEQAEK